MFGLAFGLAPAGDQQAIADGLAADVVAKGNHLATGANGSKYILPVLSQYGHADLAYQVATNPTAPGWGQWFLQCGATTMWEAWEDSSCDVARSRDHAFMGTVDDWLFEGCRRHPVHLPRFPDPHDRSGRGREPDQGVRARRTRHWDSVSSRWTRSGSSFDLTVRIPVGAQASVCVPAGNARSVTESGVPISRASGVTVSGTQGSCVQVHVGSGTYKFHSTLS